MSEERVMNIWARIGIYLVSFAVTGLCFLALMAVTNPHEEGLGIMVAIAFISVWLHIKRAMIDAAMGKG